MPGGAIVAGFSTEGLAREFVAGLGQQYVARAEMTMRALDEIVDADPRYARIAETMSHSGCDIAPSETR